MKALKLYFILSFLVIGTVVLDGQDLVILHTNDTHSQITPQTSGDGAGLGGYERREAYVNSVRSEMGQTRCFCSTREISARELLIFQFSRAMWRLNL